MAASTDDDEVQFVHGRQIMLPDLMNSSRTGNGRPSVLLDMRPLQGPSAARGVGSYARGLLRGLIDSDFDANLTLLLDGALAEPALPAGRYRIATTARRSHGQLSAYEDAMALGRDIEAARPDVYHAIDFHLPRRSPRPLVVTLHDLIPWAWGGPRMRGERLRYALFRRLLLRADAVIAVSNATGVDAANLGVGARLHVIQEGVGQPFTPRDGAADRVRERWKVGGPYLLFVGALDARKDPRALLEAWAAARASHPDLRLLIAGAPGRQAPPGMGGAILLGRVGDEQLADLYSAATCLVFSSRYEGFGLPCLEAMACGCPVAAFRNSSLPEVVGEGGILVEDGDGRALGTAAAAIVEHRSLWSSKALEQAAKFSWDKAARQTISVYESLLR
jgi:glycosyltransferase involved in cell wall biosynthesis